MSQRIRYQKVGEGLLESRRNFVTSTGIEVKVLLDLNQKKYSILDSVTGVSMGSGGNTRNSAVLKIQAKQGLSELGVTFTEEKRERAGGSTSPEAVSASGR